MYTKEPAAINDKKYSQYVKYRTISYQLHKVLSVRIQQNHYYQ